jgi:transcription antitermination factor NusG
VNFVIDSKIQDRHCVSLPDARGAFGTLFVPCGCHSSSQYQWFVAQSEHRQERLALQWIRRLGLCAWLPEFSPVKRRSALRRPLTEAPRYQYGQRDLSADPHIRPLFRTYLLFEADLAEDLWRGVYSQPGVSAVLGTRFGPEPVPQAAMDVLWKQCAADGVIYEARPDAGRKPIGRSTAVRLTDDFDPRFAGLEGIVEYTNAQRVNILLEILGREVRLSAQRRYVEQI